MIASAATMLAFGPRPKMSAPEGRVRIQYWDKWTGLEGQQMKEVVDAFNNTVGKDKGIWVDFTSMSQIDRKTLVSTAAGVPPDIAGLWDTQVLQFASMNALEPLDSYAQQYGLTRDHYKHVFYDGCEYHGQALSPYPAPSGASPCSGIKRSFRKKRINCAHAGLDPDRPPRTMAELDKYAAAIDTWETSGGTKHLSVTGFIPLEPGTATNLMGYWFGATIADPTGAKVLINSPQMVATYNWIRGYSERLGKNALAEFRSGFSSGATGLFDTPQNPFLVGWNSMEAQGPWISAFIEKYKPSLNRCPRPVRSTSARNRFRQDRIGNDAGPDPATARARHFPGRRLYDSTGCSLRCANVPLGRGRQGNLRHLCRWKSFRETVEMCFQQRCGNNFAIWGAAPFPFGRAGRGQYHLCRHGRLGYPQHFQA